MKRVGDLEIDEDVPFQQREWRVQRVAWFVMLLIVLLAALGLFGTGPLSSATANDRDGLLAVEYQRFIRHGGEVSLTISLDGGQAKDGQVEIWISAGYLGGMDVQGVSPEAQDVRAGGDRLIYVVAVDDPAQRLDVNITLTPQRMGRFPVEIGVVDGPRVAFSQFALP